MLFSRKISLFLVIFVSVLGKFFLLMSVKIFTLRIPSLQIVLKKQKSRFIEMLVCTILSLQDIQEVILKLTKDSNSRVHIIKYFYSGVVCGDRMSKYLAQFLPEKCTKDLNPAPQKSRKNPA